MGRKFEEKGGYESSKSLPLNIESEGFEQFLIRYSFNNKEIRKILFPEKFQMYSSLYTDLGKSTKNQLKKIFLQKISNCLLNYLVLDEKGKIGRNPKFDSKMKEFLNFADSITNRNHQSLTS